MSLSGAPSGDLAQHFPELAGRSDPDAVDATLSHQPFHRGVVSTGECCSPMIDRVTSVIEPIHTTIETRLHGEHRLPVPTLPIPQTIVRRLAVALFRNVNDVRYA
jgi:hypothetical protein